MLLHFGTLVAVLIVYHRVIADLLREALTMVHIRTPRAGETPDRPKRRMIALLIASLPHQVWCESSMAYFMVGIWLNVWTPSLSELLRKPVWRPLPVYIAASVALMLSHSWTEWTTAPLTLIRNLFGMTAVARICHRVTLRHPDRDWRALAELLRKAANGELKPTGIGEWTAKKAAEWLISK